MSLESDIILIVHLAVPVSLGVVFGYVIGFVHCRNILTKLSDGDVKNE